MQATTFFLPLFLAVSVCHSSPDWVPWSVSMNVAHQQLMEACFGKGNTIGFQGVIKRATKECMDKSPPAFFQVKFNGRGLNLANFIDLADLIFPVSAKKRHT